MQIKLNEDKIKKLISGEDKLSLQLKDIFNANQQKIILLNKNLDNDVLDLFRKNKQLLMKKLNNDRESFSK